MARLTERFFMGGNPTDVETLFIMESPGEQELVCDYACVGRTGYVMTKYLCKSNAVSLGCLMKNKRESRFAIFETFDFPLITLLQDTLNTSFDKVMHELKDVDSRYGETERDMHYKELKKFWEDSRNDIFYSEKKDFIERYKKNLHSAIASLHNLKIIVVCGYIAQSCFMQAFIPEGFQKGFPPYGSLFSIPELKKFRLYFSNHPSVELRQKNKKAWKYGCDYKNGKILI